MLFVAFICGIIFTSADGLRCASCTNISNIQDCHNYITCHQGERCFTSSSGIGSETSFDLGCKSEQECLSSPATSIIGRSAPTTRCLQCCAVDNCNEKLCSAGTQVTNEIGQCMDDPKFDCQQFSTVFSICSDVVHAKTVCRKWCGLCGLVDGAWSSWGSRSNCDVTCGNGHVTRSRTCTDPAPAHGGLNCSGSSSETQTCSLNPCPVDGGWSGWQAWVTCSSSCGIGTMSRHRICNNPTPDLTGNHCFGESVDFKAFFLRSCTDGGWSLWSGWSTCLRGLRSRTRSCDNPSPSQFGRDCRGSYTDKDRCDSIAFSVTTPNGTERANGGGSLLFRQVVTNVGGGYNQATGKFTCTVPGTYFFTMTLDSEEKRYVYCYIRKNSSYITVTRTEADNRYTTASASIILVLAVGDEVDVGDCGGSSYLTDYFSVSFSGTALS